MIDIVYAASEAAQAASEGSAHAGGPVGTLGLNGKLFIAQLINFTVILMVLWRWAYRPLLKVMNERQQKIQESMDNTKKIEVRLLQTEQEYEKKMADARHNAAVIIERAQKDALDQAAAIRAQNENETRALVESARAHIRAEKEQTLKEVRQSAGELVYTAASKLLEREITQKDSDKTLSSLLHESDQ